MHMKQCALCVNFLLFPTKQEQNALKCLRFLWVTEASSNVAQHCTQPGSERKQRAKLALSHILFILYRDQKVVILAVMCYFVIFMSIVWHESCADLHSVALYLKKKNCGNNILSSSQQWRLGSECSTVNPSKCGFIYGFPISFLTDCDLSDQL